MFGGFSSRTRRIKLGGRIEIRYSRAATAEFPQHPAATIHRIGIIRLGTHNGVKRRQFFFSIHHRRQAEIFG